MKTFKRKKRKMNLKYLPKTLSPKDKRKQLNMLRKSQMSYKKNIYYTRKSVKSYKSKTSKHILNAKKKYGVTTIGATKELSNRSGCSKSALSKIINKGEGAYYSSGSRPNQTSKSWGIARLASALTSGKAGAIDYDILIKGCKRGSKGYVSAQLSRKKFGNGKRRVPKV